MNENEFNQKYPVGTPVHYHPVIGQPEFTVTSTRSEAWTLDSGHVVVKVKGKAGSVSIASIDVGGLGQKAYRPQQKRKL